MLIDILSNKPLQTFYLKDLLDNRIDFDINKEFDISSGWYNLIIEYTGRKTSIDSIIINGNEIGNFIYTGFFTDKQGKKVQPGTVLYDEAFFSIWVHTEYGVMLQMLLESITNGDWGSNLFDKYLFTVDKPLMLDKDYPGTIKSYFTTSNGPKWWLKNSVTTPYEVCDPELLANIDQQGLILELEEVCTIRKDSEKWALPKLGKSIKGGRLCMKKNSYLPFVELHELPLILKDLCTRVGFKRILNVTLQTQYPEESFAPHVDAHSEKETKMHVQGPCSFLLDLSENKENHYFKVGSSGLIPLEHGVFFNENYSHATVNTSNCKRPLLIIHGERDNNLNYYLNI